MVVDAHSREGGAVTNSDFEDLLEAFNDSGIKLRAL